MTSLPPHIAWATREPDPTEPPEPLRLIDGDPLEVLVALRRQRRPCALCTVVETGGSSPRKRGAKMVVTPDRSVVGTIGGGAIEQEVVDAAIGAISEGRPRTVAQQLTRDLGMCCGGRMTVFVEPQTYPPRLLIYGAGHIAAPTAEIAAAAGFDVTVIDPRPELAIADRLPAARVVCGDPVEHAARLDDNDAHIVIVTHDHALDQAILEVLVERPRAYIGVIGSVRKRHRFRERLEASGFSPEATSRFRTPMGLDIGAVTPAEIAVSVVAELIQVRRGRDGTAATSMADLTQTSPRTE